MNTDPVFSRGDLVQIVAVDNFGFLGRELHPRKEHIGRLAVVDDFEVWAGDEGPGFEERIVHATTLTGEPLTLMYFEVMHCGPSHELPSYGSVSL